MTFDEVEAQIRLAVHYKHQNNLPKAMAIEEECLRRCISEKGTQPGGYAILFKALGKLYILDNQLEKAKLYFAGAIQLFWLLMDKVDAKYEAEVYNCSYFLGCCSPQFLNSKFAKEERIALQRGGSRSIGSKETAMSQDDLNYFASIGFKMYQEIINADPTLTPVDRLLF
jgi:hypothetical protein